jgi:hypothetical protein
VGQKKEPGLKSAFDLAMERIEGREGKLAALSDEQKKAIAEIDRQAKAKIAEIEILMGKQLVEARAKGDADEIQKVEQRKISAIAKVRVRAEEDKEIMRQSS